MTELQGRNISLGRTWQHWKPQWLIIVIGGRRKVWFFSLLLVKHVPFSYRLVDFNNVFTAILDRLFPGGLGIMQKSSIPIPWIWYWFLNDIFLYWYNKISFNNKIHSNITHYGTNVNFSLLLIGLLALMRLALEEQNFGIEIKGISRYSILRRHFAWCLKSIVSVPSPNSQAAYIKQR